MYCQELCRKDREGLWRQAAHSRSSARIIFGYSLCQFAFRQEQPLIAEEEFTSLQAYPTFQVISPSN